MTEASHAALAAARDIAQTFAFYDEKSFTEADIAQIAEIIARHTSAPATDGEVEAAAEILDRAARAAAEFVHRAPASRRRDGFAERASLMETAARLLRSLPALRAENERLTALLERNRE